jgi:A/G-specific adenine glycosylase
MIATLLAWFDENERPLPWRTSSPWGVLVSEFMLQQTPVDRVLPVWRTWMERWPTPPSLAAASLADVLRAWGRLGYPRRARRLHESAVVITSKYAGRVPRDSQELLALPGVGEYTAAAVLAFAHGRRSIVLDTNVRRVVTRTLDGRANPPGHLTRAERERADDLWPQDDGRSARWSAAVMEFGALVCTARNPACASCPLASECAWQVAGQPESALPLRRQPTYEGSDRQARGAILEVLRQRPDSVPAGTLVAAWPDEEQVRRALDTLVADGLVVRLPRGRYGLPHA